MLVFDVSPVVNLLLLLFLLFSQRRSFQRLLKELWVTWKQLCPRL